MQMSLCFLTGFVFHQREYAVYELRFDNDLIMMSISLLSSSCIMCKYVFCVVVMFECPSLLATLAMETPAKSKSEACV